MPQGLKNQTGALGPEGCLSVCQHSERLGFGRTAEAAILDELLSVMSVAASNSTALSLPTIAIVGRPNVGKSTLFNRIVGSRRAIVGDEPGITRDRLYGDAEWNGRHLRIVDTGGILPQEKDFIPAEIFRQARVALDEAAAIVMVVDGRTELAGPDLELVRLLRKSNRPFFVAVNKIDSEKQSALMGDFHRLGVERMFPISAEHGRGIDDLLDAVLAEIPNSVSTDNAEVTAEATTSNSEEQQPHEVKVDATEGVSQLDAAIAGYAHESGRSTIIVVNKWDLMISGRMKSGRPTKSERMRESKRPGDRAAYEERLRYQLKFLNYAPVVFISAQTGKGTENIFSLLEEVAKERRKRISTSEMNRFLEHVDFERASVPMRQRVKILYMTQASVAPPTFVLFTNRSVKLHFSYQRFLENQIRDAFGFVGTPIWIKNRARNA